MDKQELYGELQRQVGQEVHLGRVVDEINKLNAEHERVNAQFYRFFESVSTEGRAATRIVLDRGVEGPNVSRGDLVALFWAGDSQGGSIVYGDGTGDRRQYSVSYIFIPENVAGDNVEHEVAFERFPVGPVLPNGVFALGWGVSDISRTDSAATRLAAEERRLRMMKEQLTPEGEKSFYERATQTLQLLKEAAKDPKLNPRLAAQLGS